MYRIFILAIICMACNSISKKRELPASLKKANAALDSAFGYYKKEVDSAITGQSRKLQAQYSLLQQKALIKKQLLVKPVFGLN